MDPIKTRMDLQRIVLVYSKPKSIDARHAAPSIEKLSKLIRGGARNFPTGG